MIKTEAKSFDRLKPCHPLFKMLNELLVSSPKNQSFWFSAAEQAINTIFALAQSPDVICGQAIKTLFEKLQTTVTSDTNNSPENEDHYVRRCDRDLLCRLLFLVGHVALKQLIHLENIQAEMQRRRSIPSSQSKSKKPPLHSLALSPSAFAVFNPGWDVPLGEIQEAVELELGMGMAGEDEREAEWMHQIIERQIVSGHGLLATFTPLILSACVQKQAVSETAARGLLSSSTT